MSYSLQTFLIDIPHLQSLYGSNDQQLFADIVRDQKAEFAENDRWFKSEIETGAINLEDALREIINGECSHPDDGFQYGYALELLCRQFGKHISSGALAFFEDLQFETKLLTSGPPIPIPDPDGFPSIGYLTATEANEEFKQLEKQINDDDGESDDLVEMREEFAENLQQAVDQQLGMVTFIY